MSHVEHTLGCIVRRTRPMLPQIGLNVRESSRFHLVVRTFGAHQAASGRSVCTIIGSLHSPLERFSRQSMGVLLTIGGNCADLRAKMVWVSRHLPLYLQPSMLVPQMGSGFPRKRC